MPEDKKVIEHFRLLLEINIFWVALSFLFDGINTLVLPLQIIQFAGSEGQATLLGLLTLAGLLLGALVNPLAVRSWTAGNPCWTERNHWEGLALCLISLFLFARSTHICWPSC